MKTVRSLMAGFELGHGDVPASVKDSQGKHHTGHRAYLGVDKVK